MQSRFEECRLGGIIMDFLDYMQNLIVLRSSFAGVCVKISYTPNNYFSNASSEPTEEQLKAIEDLLRQASEKITEIRNKK